MPKMVEGARDAISHLRYSRISFDEDKVTGILGSGLANPDFFCDIVVDDDGWFRGALVAKLLEYPFSRDKYALCLVFYIEEECRSLANALGLLRNFVAWGKERDVKELRLDQSTGFKMKKFGLLAKRAGFSLVGTKWTMEF